MNTFFLLVSSLSLLGQFSISLLPTLHPIFPAPPLEFLLPLSLSSSSPSLLPLPFPSPSLLPILGSGPEGDDVL